MSARDIPTRRQRLTRRTPQRRTPLRARAALRRFTPLARESAKHHHQRRAVDPVVEAVLLRDGGCVLRRHPDVAKVCFGPLSAHHLRKQSAGGRWLPGNLVALCCHHQVWVEDYPNKAWGLGLVVRNGETLREAWAAMRAQCLAVGERQ